LEAVKSQQQQASLESASIQQLTVALTENASLYNTMDLAALAPYLTKNATVSVELSVKDNDVCKNVHTSFLLAGLQSQSEKRDSNRIVLTAAKSAKNGSAAGGTAAPIRITLNVSDFGDDDAEMIDEDNLLSDASNLLAPPPSMSDAATKDDCSGREACADCSCGRATENKPPGTTTKQQPVQKSSCGKCTLGDAFRCASCPYLGKPAFKAGEEHLVLDLQDDF